MGLAQVNDGFGIGPRMGYYQVEDAEEGSIFGGIQLRGRLSPYFGVEAAVEYNPKSEFGVTNGATVEVSSVPVTASALLFLPVSQKFVPYGLAGLGAYYNVYDTEGAAEAFEIDNTFNLGYHLGFGLQIPFNQNIALNADYRYRFLNPDTNEENLDDTSFNGNGFRLGLTFYL